MTNFINVSHVLENIYDLFFINAYIWLGAFVQTFYILTNFFCLLVLHFLCIWQEMYFALSFYFIYVFICWYWKLTYTLYTDLLSWPFFLVNFETRPSQDAQLPRLGLNLPSYLQSLQCCDYGVCHHTWFALTFWIRF